MAEFMDENKNTENKDKRKNRIHGNPMGISYIHDSNPRKGAA
jgi:hypothetical protein